MNKNEELSQIIIKDVNALIADEDEPTVYFHAVNNLLLIATELGTNPKVKQSIQSLIDKHSHSRNLYYMTLVKIIQHNYKNGEQNKKHLPWYKQNQEIQKCLLKFNQVRKLIKQALHHKNSASYQLKAIHIVHTIKNNAVIEKLYNTNGLFRQMYQSIHNTVHAIPFSVTDVMSINADVNVLLTNFGSLSTYDKVLNADK